jgi:hypothetical protein
MVAVSLLVLLLMLLVAEADSVTMALLWGSRRSFRKAHKKRGWTLRSTLFSLLRGRPRPSPVASTSPTPRSPRRR